MKRFHSAWRLLAAGIAFTFFASGPAAALEDTPVQAAPMAYDPDYRVFAFNDLGMHCYDDNFSVFSILPLFNVLRAQALRRGRVPRLLTDADVEMVYKAKRDASGSINTTSVGKTNFWKYVDPLFGLSPPPDEGLLGSRMPGSENRSKAFGDYDGQTKWFSADGIPITDIDDDRRQNPYPLMLVKAKDARENVPLAALRVVVPVSREMRCSDCHLSGGVGADDEVASRHGVDRWSDNPKERLQYRENILILHDALNGTNLSDSQPVLCASCHYSFALDLAQTGPRGDQLDHLELSLAIHRHHGKTVDQELPEDGNPAIVPEDGIDTCYQCHPGRKTQCFRGAMASAGLICQDCHGGMLAVGGQYPLRTGETRRPWRDLPMCQSCHTGDALDHKGSKLILRRAYSSKDPAATPRAAANERFAEEDGLLYRNSLGHGGMACEACHGSPHAEWPVEPSSANDNLAAKSLQGYRGTLFDCGICHTRSIDLTLDGPHGMHQVDDPEWMDEHGDFYEDSPRRCKACHGLKLEGTELSRTATRRVLETEEDRGRVTLSRGTAVGCTLCHEDPRSMD